MTTYKPKSKYRISPSRVPMFDNAGRITHYVGVGGPIHIEREAPLLSETIEEATDTEYEILYVDRGMVHAIQAVEAPTTKKSRKASDSDDEE